MKNNIGIVVEFGFHDIKKFIYSGFLNKLKQKGYNIIWLTNKTFESEISSILEENGIILNLTIKDKSSVIEKLNNSIRKANNRINKETFSNYNTNSDKIRFKDYIIGNSLAKFFFERLTLLLLKYKFNNIEIFNQLDKFGVRHIVFLSYGSGLIKNLYYSTIKSNIKLWYINNNIKDLYINDFFSFFELNGIFVKDEISKNLFLKKFNQLKKVKFHNTIDLGLEPYFNYNPKRSLDFYSNKYNFSKNAKILYYTMASPLININEIEIVNYISKEIINREEFLILVRRNPQHNVKDFNDFIINSNVRLTESYSTFDLIKDINFQTFEGEIEYRDLIYYSYANLSLPSNVAYEFNSMNKPIFNIKFNSKGFQDKMINYFFETLMFNNHISKIENLYIINSIIELNIFLESFQNSELSKSELNFTSIVLLNEFINE